MSVSKAIAKLGIRKHLIQDEDSRVALSNGIIAQLDQSQQLPLPGCPTTPPNKAQGTASQDDTTDRFKGIDYVAILQVARAGEDGAGSRGREKTVLGREGGSQHRLEPATHLQKV